MNNSQTIFLCHYASKEDKNNYNKSYYQKNKNYWVQWRQKQKVNATPGSGFSIEKSLVRSTQSNLVPGEERKQVDRKALEESRKAYESAQKGNRIPTQTSGWDSGAKALADAGWKKRYEETIVPANRVAAKKTALGRPVAMVNLAEIERERNMPAIAKAVRSVRRFLDKASATYKESWKIGAADLIKLGKQIKDAWDNPW